MATRNTNHKHFRHLYVLPPAGPTSSKHMLARSWNALDRLVQVGAALAPSGPKSFGAAVGARTSGSFLRCPRHEGLRDVVSVEGGMTAMMAAGKYL